ISALQTSEYFGTGEPAGRLGSAHPRNAPYQAFEAADGFFVVAAGNDSLWKEVCGAVNLPELVSNPLFKTQRLRARNQKKLGKVLEKEFRKKTITHWLEEFRNRGVPCSPINNFAEVMDDPQIEHMQLVEDITLPNGKVTKTVKFPIAITGYDLNIYRESPLLGEHNDEVKKDWIKNNEERTSD